jgi:hypothetical protein
VTVEDDDANNDEENRSLQWNLPVVSELVWTCTYGYLFVKCGLRQLYSLTVEVMLAVNTLFYPTPQLISIGKT